MPLVVFTCEHCGEEANLFLRASQMGKPVTCPNCQKEIQAEGEKVTDSTPAPTDQGPT